jgi:hypothetical protein
MSYENLLIGLTIDLVAISILSYAVYFRRHHRRDLTLGFIGVNVGLFAVASFIVNDHLGVGLGIGLFALLSVIRLRSTQVTQEEIGYYFIALVLGLVNGVSPEESWGRTAILNALLIGVMFVADHPRVLPRSDRRIVTLKGTFKSDTALRAQLEKRIGGTVTRFHVIDADYVHHRTKVDVRFRSGTEIPEEHVLPEEPVAAEPATPQLATPQPATPQTATLEPTTPEHAIPEPALTERATPEPAPREAAVEARRAGAALAEGTDATPASPADGAAPVDERSLRAWEPPSPPADE